MLEEEQEVHTNTSTAAKVFERWSSLTAHYTDKNMHKCVRLGFTCVLIAENQGNPLKTTYLIVMSPNLVLITRNSAAPGGSGASASIEHLLQLKIQELSMYAAFLTIHPYLTNSEWIPMIH